MNLFVTTVQNINNLLGIIESSSPPASFSALGQVFGFRSLGCEFGKF